MTSPPASFVSGENVSQKAPNTTALESGEENKKNSIFLEIPELPDYYPSDTEEPELPETEAPEIEIALPPPYDEEGIVNLPLRPDTSHLDDFVDGEGKKIWIGLRFRGQYVLITYKDKIKKSDILAFLREKYGAWLIEIDEKDPSGKILYGIRIAHETICLDGGYRPHTHVFVGFRGRLDRNHKICDFFTMTGVEAPDIRLVGGNQEHVIRYLQKEDVDVEPMIVVDANGKKHAIMVDKIPEFPAEDLVEKFQKDLWDFFVGEEWNYKNINYIVERENKRDRNDFINSFSRAYNALIIEDETLADKTLWAKEISRALDVRKALGRRKGENRYVIISLNKVPGVEEMARIYNLTRGCVRGGRGVGNDNFNPPRVLVFSKKSVGTKVGIWKRKVKGVFWNIGGMREVIMDSSFVDWEWNLGVIYGRGGILGLDWMLRRCGVDWEEDERQVIEEREQKERDEVVIKAEMSYIKKIISGFRYKTYEVRGVRENKEGDVNIEQGKQVNIFCIGVSIPGYGEVSIKIKRTEEEINKIRKRRIFKGKRI